MKNTIKDLKIFFRDEVQQKPKHDLRKVKLSINVMIKEGLIDKGHIFNFCQFIFLNRQVMQGTHSYGFHTAYGRALINNFSNIYYSL
jgi:hypothetical protein